VKKLSLTRVLTLPEAAAISEACQRMAARDALRDHHGRGEIPQTRSISINFEAWEEFDGIVLCFVL
jgi:hypothetical protein